MDKCEQINEDLRQDRRDSIAINVNDLTDDAFDTLNDASNDAFDSLNNVPNDIYSPLYNNSPLHSNDCSPASFKSQAVDEPSISEDESNTYVIYSNCFLYYGNFNLDFL